MPTSHSVDSAGSPRAPKNQSQNKDKEKKDKGLDDIPIESPSSNEPQGEPMELSSVSKVVEYHDDTRTVVTFEADEIIETRPYTATESAEADARLLRQKNADLLVADSATAITELLTSIGTLQLIVSKANNAIGPADTKDVARELRRLYRHVVRLTRLSVGKLDSADIGPV